MPSNRVTVAVIRGRTLSSSTPWRTTRATNSGNSTLDSRGVEEFFHQVRTSALHLDVKALELPLEGVQPLQGCAPVVLAGVQLLQCLGKRCSRCARTSPFPVSPFQNDKPCLSSLTVQMSHISAAVSTSTAKARTPDSCSPTSALTPPLPSAVSVVQPRAGAAPL